MKTRISLTAGALVLALSSVTTLATPAAAVPPSRPGDPQHLLLLGPTSNGPWADTLPAPLYDDVSPMVPGDAPSESFYAFNNTGTRGSLSLSCRVSAVPPPGTPPGTPVTDYDDLANALDLEYRVGGTGGFKPCNGTATDEVNGRRSKQVEVRLIFDEGEPAAMNQSAWYSITVTLRQSPPGRGGGRPAQVLGTQTLIASPQVSSPTTTSGTRRESKGTSAPVKSTTVAATVPPEGGVSDVPLSLIGLLLATGALLAGLRHRRSKPD